MAYNLPVFTQLAMDSFQRANENPLSQGGNWLQPDSLTFLKILGNVAEPTAIPNICIEYYSGGISWPADQYSEATLQTLTDANSFAGPQVRQSAGADTSYGIMAEGPLSSATTMFLLKRVASVQTTLATLSASLKPGDHLRLAVQGTTLSVYINGQLVSGSVQTDSAIASGFPSLRAQVVGNLADAQFGGWFGGSVTTPTIVVPEVGPGTISSRSPLITPGWPLASAPAANPVAAGPNSPAQTPDPGNAGQVARQTRALVQANETNSRLI